VKCVSKGHKKPGVLKLKCTEDDFCVNVDAKTLKVIGEPEEKVSNFCNYTITWKFELPVTISTATGFSQKKEV